jgi:small-conductance mechanosensitive channel
VNSLNNGLDPLAHAKDTLIDLAVRFGPKVLVALLILIVGVFVAGWVARATDRGLNRLDLEPPVRQLLSRVARLFVIGLFLILALQNLGVELLPLIAGLGVAGAGIALATQGVLSNMVAGLAIIFTKPYRVGEYISIVGVEGQVDAITSGNPRFVSASPTNRMLRSRSPPSAIWCGPIRVYLPIPSPWLRWRHWPILRCRSSSNHGFKSRTTARSQGNSMCR